MTTNDQKKLSATSAQELYSLLRGTTSGIGSPYPFSEAASYYLLLESGDYMLLESGDKFILENG